MKLPLLLSELQLELAPYGKVTHVRRPYPGAAASLPARGRSPRASGTRIAPRRRMLPPPADAPVKVGLCGFTMAMARYPQHFGLLEVQQSFYEPPADRVVQRWREAMPSDFEFTVKAWQLITHESKSPTYRRLKRALSERERAGCGRFRDTPIVREAMARTLAVANTLRASTVLFQCPKSFGPDADNVESLRHFIEEIARPQCPPGLRLAWEPRGPAWSAQAQLARRICEDLQLIYVVDPFVDAIQVTNAGPAYLRLHGIGGARHVYTDEELEQLAERVPRGGYVLFNNLPRVGDARRFQEMMKRR